MKAPNYSDCFPLPHAYNKTGHAIYVKSDVILDGLMPVIFDDLLPRLASFWYKRYDSKPNWFESVAARMILTITCGREAEHKDGSRHYLGLAIDIRSRDMPYEEREDFIKKLGAYLGRRWKVVSSTNCIHIQYQGYRVDG